MKKLCMSALWEAKENPGQKAKKNPVALVSTTGYHVRKKDHAELALLVGRTATCKRVLAT